MLAELKLANGGPPRTVVWPDRRCAGCLPACLHSPLFPPSRFYTDSSVRKAFPTAPVASVATVAAPEAAVEAEQQQQQPAAAELAAELAAAPAPAGAPAMEAAVALAQSASARLSHLGSQVRAKSCAGMPPSCLSACPPGRLPAWLPPAPLHCSC